MYKIILKPIIDLFLALIGLFFLLPILIIVTILLLFANQGKPFFFQLRPGLKGEIFKIIKFKTMNDKKDVNGNLLPDAQRLTKIGNFVRKTSLDELPQLLNVISGSMSIIGPRPLLPDYLHMYNDFQNRRHELKPGITGWAQVNGRNAISWDKKFELDVWYVDNISFFLDLKIIILTIKKVFSSKDIYTTEGAPIEPFDGK
jgi:undecaprenyl phosphate N,N'-diacetylbacillosamine 1-phosphate transferase